MTPTSVPKFRLFILLLLVSTSFFAQVSYENAFPNLSFNFPVEMQAPPDGSNRLCVLEQPGIIKVFPNSPSISQNEVATFLDISNKVAYSSGQEIGLLGLAFHPQFTSNGYVFVYYIDRPNNYRINIVRYTVSQENPNLLDETSEFVIAQFQKNQSDSNHNGGKIAFGPDGYLYISIGDGGGGGDPQKNGQNLNTVFGSILRIDVDIDGNNPLETNPELPNGNYEIPSDNPRVGQEGLDELFAWGIRNTWKFSFDEQGRLWGADVGQNAFEEINLIEKGGNYGWNRFEAESQPSYGSGTSLVTTPDSKPLFYYDHNSGDVSITGGYWYKGGLLDSRLQNAYVYGDYVSGRVWALRYDEASKTVSNELLFKTNGTYISSFSEDESGELYFLGYSNSAKIYRLSGNSSGPETIQVNGVGNWSPLNAGTNGTVECLITDSNGNLIIGGNFSNGGGVSVGNLAIYDSNGNWSAYTSGSNGPILDMALSDNGNLFVAGDFSEIGGIPANNIAYYDGENWNSLGNGTNGPISKISFDKSGSVLYAGGVFSNAGELTVNNIAKWENGNWLGLTDSSTSITGTNNEIRAIAFDEENNLYIGGNFDLAGGRNANRIARWDGTNWDALGTGTSGFVHAIVISNGFVYAGGNFVNAGNSTVRRIARFHLQNQTWEGLSAGISGNVNDLNWHNGNLYVTGTFETASDISTENKVMNNVARWNPTLGWQALGPGMDVGIDNRGNSLCFIEETKELFLGGNFGRAGNSSNTNNIAIWSLMDTDGDGVPDTEDECPETPENTIVSSNGCPLAAFPSDQFTLSTFKVSCLGTATGILTITSKSSGNYQAVLSDEEGYESLNFNESISFTDLASGTYNVCLKSINGQFLESCYNITIGEPEPLSVSTSMNFIENTVSVSVTGTSRFRVQLNQEFWEDVENEITLPLTQEVNNLTIISEEGCHGSYSETLLMESAITAYPSPFTEQLELFLNNFEGEKEEILVYNTLGQIVFSETLPVYNKTIKLDTSQWTDGLYVVQIGNGKKKRIIKVLKS